MYGASDFAYWCGHYASTVVYSTLQAALITVLCWYYLPANIMLTSMFFLVILFILASLSLVIFITAFMDSTRVAMFVYTTIYFLLLVPFVVLAASQNRSSMKGYILLLAPPAALACGLDRFVGGFRSTSIVVTDENPSLPDHAVL